MKMLEMNRRLLLEAPERIADGAGGFEQTWVARGHVWAAVEIRGAGREVDQASRLPLRITMRAVPPASAAYPDAEMRFRDGGRLYRIEAVHQGDPLGRTLTCFAVEEVGR
jgi:head-tail adaptor